MTCLLTSVTAHLLANAKAGRAIEIVPLLNGQEPWARKAEYTAAQLALLLNGLDVRATKARRWYNRHGDAQTSLAQL